MTDYNAIIITVPAGMEESVIQDFVALARYRGGAATYHTRQYLTPPEGSPYASLPAHEFLTTEDGESDRHCRWCGKDPNQFWATYDEYRAWWVEHEWEGKPDHYPEMRESWEYKQKTCNVG